MSVEEDSGAYVCIGGYSRSDGSEEPSLRMLARGGAAHPGLRGVAGLHLPNPTFGAFDRRRSTLYLSHSNEVFVSAVQVDVETNALRVFNSVQLGTLNPAHISLSPCGNYVTIASFTSGHVSMVEITASGALGGVAVTLRTTAAGGPLKTQTGSQPHQTVFSPGGKHLLVPDRGADRVILYRFDPAAGSLKMACEFRCRPGSGPRHMKFNPINPKICYIVNELDSTTSVFAWDECSETLDLVDIVSTIPSTFVGENYAAELDVARNGKRIYISNRGHDSIVSFRLADSGAIVAGGEWTQAGGKWPRFIGLDDDDESLWVAAQNSDVVCRFSVDVHSGSLRLEESKRFHAPAFVTSI